jgi:hypothetical protein
MVSWRGSSSACCHLTDLLPNLSDPQTALLSRKSLEGDSLESLHQSLNLLQLLWIICGTTARKDEEERGVWVNLWEDQTPRDPRGN